MEYYGATIGEWVFLCILIYALIGFNWLILSVEIKEKTKEKNEREW